MLPLLLQESDNKFDYDLINYKPASVIFHFFDTVEVPLKIKKKKGNLMLHYKKYIIFLRTYLTLADEDTTQVGGVYTATEILSAVS